jgi:hypothetical protein
LYFFGPFVEVPPSADLTFTGDFSIDAWIRVVECGMSGGGVLAPIVDKWDPTTQTGFSLFVDQPSPSTGFLKLQLNNMLFTSTGSLPTGANPLANTGPWVHVAVTVNRTTGVGTFYINGAPAGTFTVPAGSITNALTMLIGEIRVPGGRCELAIDELELFKRELTPKEVQISSTLIRRASADLSRVKQDKSASRSLRTWMAMVCKTPTSRCFLTGCSMSPIRATILLARSRRLRRGRHRPA